MGQGLSCGKTEAKRLIRAVQMGDMEAFEQVVNRDSALVRRLVLYDRNSLLHLAAANGQIEILSLLLELSVKPDVLNKHKQTPLMLAAMNGKISCVKKLIEAGANILLFDSMNERTCLHYSAYYGHVDCLETILSVARTSSIAASWGFSRFVNIRDRKGTTPLHLAARRRHPRCVRVLLNNAALVSASTSGYGLPGSTPLHLAARGGSLDCIRELLACGADRLHRDASGRTPFAVALRYNHEACAALLNPSSLEPLVWPSPLKFISELNEEAKALLEQALMEANKEREKTILKGTHFSMPSPSGSDSEIKDAVSDIDLCSICFDQCCKIEIQDCGHQMCAQCTLELCCHSKPKPSSNACLTSPVCPFCRSSISKLIIVAKVKEEVEEVNSWKHRKSCQFRNVNEGSSSFKSLSFGKTGRGSGRIAAEVELLDKALSSSHDT